MVLEILQQSERECHGGDDHRDKPESGQPGSLGPLRVLFRLWIDRVGLLSGGNGNRNGATFRLLGLRRHDLRRVFA